MIGKHLHFIWTIALIAVWGSVSAQPIQTIPLTKEKVAIDGLGKEMAWSKSAWIPLTHLWAGTHANPADFKGRIKYLTDENYLYVLAEIEDDSLVDINKDPVDHYWDDDCLEVFIDADASGGIHQNNHTAFAYHLSLAGHALDLGESGLPIFMDDHITQKRVCKGNQCTWEVRFKLYANDYKEGKPNQRVKLNKGNKIRVACAYCDNDYSSEREHFYGSMPIPGEDKNRAWMNASLFPLYQIK